MRHQFPLGLVAALAGALAGCGDSSGPGANQSFRATDPSGDTFGSQTVQPDLTAFTIVHDTGGIDVMLDFTANVQSPVTGGTNVVVGFIDLDTDQDSTTGTGSAVDVFRPDGGSTGMGVEYYVDLFGYNADSTVLVYDALAGTPTGSVRPRFQGRRITVRVPRAAGKRRRLPQRRDRDRKRVGANGHRPRKRPRTCRRCVAGAAGRGGRSPGRRTGAQRMALG